MRRLSLRTKVFFLFAGASLLIVAPALILIRDAVRRGVYERAEADLASAATALESNWRLRDSLLLAEATARASQPGLDKAWLEGDMTRVARLLRKGLDRDRVVLAADTTGLVLVGPPLDPQILRDAQVSRQIVAYTDGEGRPTRMALWPVWTDSGVVGVTGVGTRLGKATVQDVKSDLALGVDVALVAGDSLIAATFGDTLSRALSANRLPAMMQQQGTARWDLAGKPFLSSARPLRTGGAPASILFFRPIANELQVAGTITGSMVGIGGVALVMALILALVVARIVARPAQALAAAAAGLARGDFRAPLPRAASDEIGQLARAFGEMRQAIAEREARLRSAQAEMIHREKLAAMGRLVAQLSHEINNPIYNIQNCLEALERRGDPRDPNREFLTLAQEELARMAKLTRQLLDQSRPLSDAAAALSLNGIVQRVLILAAPELQARGIRVETSLERELPLVVAHSEAIHQVLANLVDNAGDAMGEGDTLRLVTRSDEDVVEIVVEDTGVGIDPEHLPHIFEAFYTTKPGVQGIGLGLFVSEGIIRGHRGRLLVESRPGEGSRFTIRLPRETLDETAGAPEAAAEAA